MAVRVQHTTVRRRTVRVSRIRPSCGTAYMHTWQYGAPYAQEAGTLLPFGPAAAANVNTSLQLFELALHDVVEEGRHQLASRPKARFGDEVRVQALGTRPRILVIACGAEVYSAANLLALGHPA